MIRLKKSCCIISIEVKIESKVKAKVCFGLRFYFALLA